MKMDNLNRWLTLLANAGVLIGIVVVAIELQQTQTEMTAEASTLRAQMAIDIRDRQTENRIYEIGEKLRTSRELTIEEDDRLRNFISSLMRFFENLHFQYQLGVLDEEIWQGNYSGLSGLCGGSIYQYVFPDGFNDTTHRASFRALVSETCENQ
jgi:hypothetical protein